ncbi:MarR family winged helix-turn-helix transcriptional regulator [Paenibacillus tarimensis]|uniref:MarR family winged helix-turn-helix transcriptional regulator n=1 Tax=Paenibacillus tarimensis TaxID=416012 RepID=UPI001F48A052|nr:MarR family transcriptional regulator [Paenibacillus tarimensis]MCF2944275.1 MarR family transcriptional regulator [Paenibacillus tarimensis]
MDKQLLASIIGRYEEVSFTVNRRLNALIRRGMGEELTLDQYSTIRYIRKRGRCTSSELADIFCVGKSSITAIITRLSDKKMIERVQDDKDRRVTYLSLTEEGERTADEIEERIQELLTNYISHFDNEEAIRFIETYEKLGRLLLD